VESSTETIDWSVTEEYDYEEIAAGAYVNQLVGRWFAVGASYQFTRSRLHHDLGSDWLGLEPPTGGDLRGSYPRNADLHQGLLHVAFNHESGVFANASAVSVFQTSEDSGAPVADEDLIQLNLAAGFRFPRRRAEVALGILNATDQDYRLDPLSYYPRLRRERTFWCSLRFAF
jgi:hypothetical protein